MKQSEFRELVNELRDITRKYAQADQLRDQIALCLARHLGDPVSDIVPRTPVLDRIDDRLACDVISAPATIEALKVARAEIERLSGELEAMRKQEPVAWMEWAESAEAWFLAYSENRDATTRPLYAAPVPATPGVPAVTATAYRWRYRGAIMWQYGELTEENARLAEEHNHEVQPLYAAPVQAAPSVPDGWTFVPERLVEMFCGAADNLGDMPISEAWAERWSNEASDLLEKHNYFSEHAARGSCRVADESPDSGNEPVRAAWARFCHELHRSPDAPYPGMSEAFERHFSQSFTDRDWRREAQVWAAAWKAAKRHGADGKPEGA